MLARSTLLLTAPGGRQPRAARRSRAFDGIDNAAMGFQLAPTHSFKPRRSDLGDHQQLFSDYRRRSLAADSDNTSTAGRMRGEQDLPSTTPVGSYINGVLGGPRHPGLADDVDDDDDDDDDAVGEDGDEANAMDAAAAGPNDARTFARAASGQLVRLRAENAKLQERLHSAEQRLRQAERERSQLADKAAALVDELEDARQELAGVRRQTAALRSQREQQLGAPSEAADATAASATVSASTSTSPTLDSELEQANRRVQSLERSMLEMKRRFARLEDGPTEAEHRSDAHSAAAAADSHPDVPPAGAPASPSLIMAAGAMSQEIADLRTDTETLRRRLAQQAERRQQQLEEAKSQQAGDQRASEAALLAVALGLETAKAQNSELRQLLDRSEREKSAQGQRLGQLKADYGRMRASAEQSGQAWDEWAAQVEAGRADLRQLGAANAALRDQLQQLERWLRGLQRDLDQARAEAAGGTERCRQLTAEAQQRQAELRRAREAEAKAAELGAGLARALAGASAENRALQRRLGLLAESAQRAALPELGRQLKELAASVRTDLQVAGSGPETSTGTNGHHPQSNRTRQSHAQLAALIEQIDVVESKSDHLMMMRRHAAESEASSAPPAPRKSVPTGGGGGGDSGVGDRTDVQRLMRMLLYNSNAV